MNPIYRWPSPVPWLGLPPDRSISLTLWSSVGNPYVRRAILSHPTLNRSDRNQTCGLRSTNVCMNQLKGSLCSLSLSFIKWRSVLLPCLASSANTLYLLLDIRKSICQIISSQLREVGQVEVPIPLMPKCTDI